MSNTGYLSTLKAIAFHVIRKLLTRNYRKQHSTRRVSGQERWGNFFWAGDHVRDAGVFCGERTPTGMIRRGHCQNTSVDGIVQICQQEFHDLPEVFNSTYAMECGYRVAVEVL
jgi:hypothetical protein